MTDEHREAGERQPPPSQQEILWDWFLTEIKDVAALLEEARGSLAECREAFGELSRDARQQIDTLNRESVAAHRDLRQVVNDVKASQAKQRPMDIQAVVRQSARHTAALVVIASAAGGVVGGIAVALLLPLIQ